MTTKTISKTKRGSDVRSIFSNALDTSGKSLVEIAEEIGYANPNFLTLIKSGKNKIPIHKAADIAVAIGLDPAMFLRTCLTEYQPEIMQTVEEHLGAVLSKGEKKIIRTVRSASPKIDVAPKSADETAELKELVRSWSEVR